MWVAIAVDRQDESVYQMYDYLLSRLKWETSHSGTWLANSLTQENILNCTSWESPLTLGAMSGEKDIV